MSPSPPRPSTDVLSAHLEGESVLLDVASKRYFQLNASAAVLWRGLEHGSSLEVLVERLQERFQVDRTTAEASVKKVIETLRENGLLEGAGGGPWTGEGASSGERTAPGG
jgi:hypothetical protein